MSDIRRIERAQGEFAIPEYGYKNEYYSASLEGKVYIYFHLQRVPDSDFVQLHINLKSFNVKVFRELKKDFEAFKEALRLRGITRILGFKDEENIGQWLKIIRLLGFGPPMPVALGDGKLYQSIAMRL